MRGGDWSQDGYTIAHNGVFVSKTQLNLVKLDVHVYLADINSFNKVIGDHWLHLAWTKTKCQKL